MKSNLKSVLVTMIVVSLFFTSGIVYAAEGSNFLGSAISQVGGVLTNSIGGTLTGIISTVTGNPVITGVVGAGVSAYLTYDALSDLNVSKLMHTDRVNISDRVPDFFNEDSKKELVIDPAKEIVLTDKNVLDVDFVVTVKDLTTYRDLTKNPNMRLTEKTEEIKVLDSNNQPVAGQKRGVLFEDANQTIKQAYEYRTLLIKYKEAKYDKQPVKLEIGASDIVNIGWLFNFYSSGAESAKSEIDEKIFSFDITKNKYPEIPVEKIQKFHLLFNSRVDDNEMDIDLSLLDCTTEDGKILGTTGTEVLPRVVYNWDFRENNIVTPITGEKTKVKNSEWCDVSNNGIYCDATQLSIEVLQKINKINEIVSASNASFTCPTAVIDQELVSDINNVGITYINVENISSSRLKFTYKVRGNYQLPSIFSTSESLFDINYEVIKKADSSFNWVKIASGSIPVDQSYLNTGGNLEDQIEIDEFLEEPTDTDIIEIKLTLTNFHESIANNETGNNLLDNTLTTQTNIAGGTIGCSLPKTSENLNKYYSGFDEKLYHFKAYLMKDGYSEDFKKDFDEYYRLTFLKDTPQWYGSSDILTTVSNYMPLYKYFTDIEKFKFVLMNSGSVTNQTLSGPGRYDIKIIIHYDDSWKLFNDAGNMTGKIEVVISKEQNPEIDYPLYYMPLDGLVGSTGDKTRNGYGVDYLNDKVPIYLDSQNNYSGTMFTEGYVSSNTVSTIDTKEVKEFAIMNNGNERGKLLSINRENNLLKLRYIPSRATPVVMKVKNTAVNTPAWAFYKLSLGLPLGQGGEVASPGTSLAYWTGFSNCKDFTGVPLLESFFATPDLVSTESELSPVTQSQSFSYGIEWNKDIIVRTGNVWMYTIFYTPSNFRTGGSTSYLHRDVANDSLKFYTLDNQAGSEDYVALKNRFNSDIISITDIFDLVTQKKACVNYDNRSFEVFYNPKEISKELTNKINSKIEAAPDNTGDEFSCIKH